MAELLEYEIPTDVQRPWYTQVPCIVLLLIVLVPDIVFSLSDRSPPGEKWRFDEIILPVIGCPIAITFAVLSYSQSSTARRIGLLIVLGFSSLGLFALIRNVTLHW